YVLAGFVMGTVLQEFRKGIGARRRMYAEGSIPALFRLIARNRRRYGGYIVHVGIVVLFSAFAGMAFKKELDVTLRAGESVEAVDPYGHRWRFVSDGVSEYEQLNRLVTAVSLVAYRDGERVGLIKSERRQHVDAMKRPTFEPSTEVGILSSARQDVYIVLAGEEGDAAAIFITFNPLVVWVWVGCAIMVLGGLIVMWPQAERPRLQAGYAARLAPEHALAASGD
ncbi:MAG TPA: cytochrome c-type biogenesis CcmF C-terminal domain-containing protein, partial [Gemmatimonadaceae bacterium]|nr:cytochrome c-type biogenesis CcmF C-terminal domain-containing protein [Gemmatimonadaceae bacterium]